MKILLAADGSRFTSIAARHVASHVQWFSTPPEVHVVHARPAIPYAGAAAYAGKAAVQKYHEEEAHVALAVAEKELRKAGVAFTSAWQVGEVPAVLAAYSKKHGIDLVVMGSRGHGALAGLALGSVATKCIATLEVPIMIVRTAPPARAASRRERVYGKRAVTGS